MIGKMHHRLTIQEEIIISDSGGGQPVTWQDIAQDPNIWGNVSMSSIRNNIQAQQKEQTIKYTIITRYRNDLNVSNRILYDNRVFDIDHIVLIDEEKKYLRVIAQEEV